MKKSVFISILLLSFMGFISCQKNFEEKQAPETEGRYYKTVNNLPWAINIVTTFDWPIEKAAIDYTYTHFVEWAESEGSIYTDWYEDESGYRNEGLIYTPSP